MYIPYEPRGLTTCFSRWHITRVIQCSDMQTVIDLCLKPEQREAIGLERKVEN